MKPKVSIILPTFNRANLIARSIKSILDQTYSDFELIIVDSSTDVNTSTIAGAFNDKRIKYFKNKERSSQPQNINYGFKRSTGQFIAFQNDDDEWLPDKLQEQVSAFESNDPNIGLVYSDYFIVRSDRKRKMIKVPSFCSESGLIYEKILDIRKQWGICTVSLLIKRECFEEAGKFDENLTCLDDADLILRVSKKYLLAHIKKPLICCHQSSNGVSNDLKNTAEAYKYILNKYYADISKNKYLISQYYLEIAILYFKSIDLKNGIIYLIKARKINKLILFEYLFRFIKYIFKFAKEALKI